MRWVTALLLWPLLTAASAQDYDLPQPADVAAATEDNTTEQVSLLGWRRCMASWLIDYTPRSDESAETLVQASFGYCASYRSRLEAAMSDIAEMLGSPDPRGAAKSELDQHREWLREALLAEVVQIRAR